MRVIDGYGYSDETDRTELIEEIVLTMQDLFGISEKEARERFLDFANEAQKLVHGEMFFHETPEYWANFIYFGNDDFLIR